MPDADFIAGLWGALRPTLVAFFLLAAGVGLVLLVVSWPRRRELREQFAHGFWPPQRRRAVPWTFADLAFLLFFYFAAEILVGFVCREIGTATAEIPPLDPKTISVPEAAEWIGGAAPAGPWPGPCPKAVLGLGALADQRAHEALVTSRLRWGLRGGVVCRIGVIAFIVFWLMRRAGAAPYQFLAATHGWLPNLWRGFAFWFAVTVPLYLLFLALLLLKSFVGKSAPHPIEQFLTTGPAAADWLTAILLAVIVAPVLEELLLRGVMQPLYVEEPLLADFTILVSLVLAVVNGLMPALDPDAASGWAWGPVFFLALVGPGYLGFEWLTRRALPRPGAARGIFASALVFAILHHAVWPSPVPIFFLGLCLGWLAYRTQSLVGCVALHMLFNAVGMVKYLLEIAASR